MDNIDENSIFSFGDVSNDDLEYQNEKDIFGSDTSTEEIIEPEYQTSQNQRHFNFDW